MCMYVKVVNIVTSTEGLSYPNLLQVPSFPENLDRKCLCRWRRFLQEDRTFFLFCNVILGELLTSCLGSMKHHFEYREPFQDDLLHQNNWHKQRNVFWLLLFFWSHVCSYPSCSFSKYTGE